MAAAATAPCDSNIMTYIATSLLLLLIGGHGIAADKDAVFSSPSKLHLPDLDADKDEAAAAAQLIINEMTNQISTRRLTHSSPECWKTSIATINRWTGVSPNQDIRTSGSDYCASMTNEQQELLALELTNCQLRKGNRPFFDLSLVNLESHVQSDNINSTDSNDKLESFQSKCPIGMQNTVSNAYNSSQCLPFMSKDAWDLYHQILLYTNDVCNRLTEEIMMRHKEETTRMLVYASSSMQSVFEKIELQSVLLQDQSLMMKEHRLHLENREMEAAMAMEKLKEHTNVLMMEQAENMRVQQLESDRMHQAREDDREKEAAMAMEKMKEQTNALIKEQAETIREQLQKDLERVQETIANTSSQMQPLSSIESYVKIATSGFTLFKSLMNFFLSMNAAWIFTMFPSLHKARRYLFGIIFIGFVSEVTAVWFVDSTTILLGGDAINLIESLRLLTWALAVLAYLFYFLASFFSTSLGQSREPTMDELLQSQMEFVSKLNTAPVGSIWRSHYETPRSASFSRNELVASSVNKGSEWDQGKKRLEDEFNKLNRKPPCVARQYMPQHRSISTTSGLPVVTPVESRQSISTNKSQLQNSVRCANLLRSNVATHSTDLHYTSSGEETFTLPHDKSPAPHSARKKRKFSDIDPSSEDDFVSAMSGQYSHDEHSISSVSSGASSGSHGLSAAQIISDVAVNSKRRKKREEKAILE